MPLRLLSYLAPSVPERLFAALAEHLAVSLGADVELTFDDSRSGPRPGEDGPLIRGEVDLAFMCATSYVWSTSGPDAPLWLAGAAWVPTDPRAGGRPVYFGDLLVRSAGPSSPAGLRGRRVAYNDPVSLSGYHSLRLALTEAGIDEDEVDLVRSGSHLASLALLGAGAVDAAAVDSNVWRRVAAEQPGRHRDLRAVAALGPHPSQPAVVRPDLDGALRRAVRRSLLRAASSPVVAEVLAAARLTGFAPVTDDHYTALRAELADLEAPAVEPA